MKFFRKTLTVVLALVMLAGAFSAAACSGGAGQQTASDLTQGQSPDTPGESQTEPAETEPQFNFADYGGEEFVIYHRSHTVSDYKALYIIPSEDDSDVVSQEALRRNMIVENKFNIKLVALETDNPYSTITQDINSGECPYELVLDKRKNLGPLGMNGALVNLNSLEADYTTHWWDAKAAYGYSICGRLFVVPNDVSIANLGGCRFFYFNKEVLENFNLKSPYDFAGNNEWTLENFSLLVKSVSAPNSDGSLGIYGLVDEDTSIRNHCLVGCGVEWLTKVDEETFECKIGTDYADRSQDYLDRMKALLSDKTCVMEMAEASNLDPTHKSDYSHKYDHSRALFAQGHFLFTHSSMNCAYQFADMKKGFGVIMNPKYDSNQEEYYHKMDTNTLIFAIPKLSGIDAQKSVDILDYWGYVASSTSMEAFYELTLKAKRASDPTAAEVLDTVKASICYPISDLYNTGSTKIDIGSFISDSASTSVTKAWKAHSRTIPKSISKVVETIQALDD